MNRSIAIGTLLALTAGCANAPPPAPAAPPNILFITADDLNYDSVGAYGCRIPGITPNLDRLAREGLCFDHAHVNIAVCQPCRSTWFTGRYPHNHGARGFQPIRKDVPTLSGELRKAGYLNGILSKVHHLAPRAAFAWDLALPANKLGQGRDPARFRAAARAFFQRAKAEGKPFFLHANSDDPHRPFAGSAQERKQTQRRKKRFPPAPRTFQPDAIEVPGFLPDLPAVRKELAQYFTSVHRCDATVGALLDELDAQGLTDRTVVIFASDHGMALPFAKTNLYLASTKTPLIVRWPGQVRAGTRDGEHMIAGIDVMPTLLRLAGIEAPVGMDGRSFEPLLRGEPQAGRDHVVTFFHRTSGRRDYPMRALQTRRFSYIRNAWSDGQKVFKNESQNGLTFRAMRRAAQKDPALQRRVELFLKRVPVELYDNTTDPNGRRNLAQDPEYATVRAELNQRLIRALRQCGDPEVELFATDR